MSEAKSSAQQQRLTSVILAGATGQIGQFVLSNLVANPDVGRIYALIRRAGSIPADPKVTEVILKGEDNAQDFAQIPSGEVIDAIFCAVGTTIRKAGSQEAFRKVDYEFPVDLAAFGKKIGVKQFHLVTSTGSDVDSSTFYLKVKGETERDVAANGPDQLIVYRPGILEAHERPDSRPGECCAVFCFKYLLCCCRCGACGKIQVIPVETVAAVMVDEWAARRRFYGSLDKEKEKEEDKEAAAPASADDKKDAKSENAGLTTAESTSTSTSTKIAAAAAAAGKGKEVHVFDGTDAIEDRYNTLQYVKPAN